MDYRELEEGVVVRWDQNQQVWVRWTAVCVGQKGIISWRKRHPKFGRGNIMVWGWNGVGNLMEVEGRINGSQYMAILKDNLWQSIVFWLMIACSSTQESFSGHPAGRFSLSGYASLAKTETLDLDTPV